MQMKISLEPRWYAEIVCNIFILVVLVLGAWLWLKLISGSERDFFSNMMLLLILAAFGLAELIAFLLTHIFLSILTKLGQKDINRKKWWRQFLFYERIEQNEIP